MNLFRRVYRHFSLALLLYTPTHLVSQNRNPALPGIISMCEDSDGCANIVFQGASGVGRWTDGAVANFAIESLNDSSISLHREDPSGPVAGIQCTYTGARQGDWVEGTFVCTWAGHSDPPVVTPWHGLILPSAVRLDPKKIDTAYLSESGNITAWKVCFGPTTRMFGIGDPKNACTVDPNLTSDLWTLRRSNGRDSSDFTSADKYVEANPLFVDYFDDNSVIVRGFDLVGVNAGEARLFKGTYSGNTMRGTVMSIRPGDMKPTVGIWRASIVSTPRCDRPKQGQIDAETARLNGKLANMLGDLPGSLQCIFLSADLGVAASQNRLANLYHNGAGIKRDDDQAFAWFQKSASQNNQEGIAGLAFMYKNGFGTPVDLFRSRYLRRSDPHQQSVLAKMNNFGLSRLEAEEEVFRYEDRDGSGIGPSCQDSYVPSARWNEDAIDRRNREEAARRNAEQRSNCEQGRSRLYEKRHAYLECVRTYKDSNTIETNCIYPTYR